MVDRIKAFWAACYRYVILGAVVLVGTALAYFAGSERPKEAQQAAVDAAHSDDAVKAAEDQAKAAHVKAVELAVKSAQASAAIQHQREELSHADTAEIDALLRANGILRDN